MNQATALATVLADEVARCDVRDVVIAPGARSGPLAQALYLQAARSGQHLHYRFDERTAGFLALGLARRSGRPALVLCTSGTAGANLHPAVLEARHAHVPLLVVTADRPPEMRGTGASQTTDQQRLFGPAVTFVELDSPPLHDGAAAANRYWRSVLCRAVADAAHGPVHLNIGFREPLDFAASQRDPQLDGRADGSAWVLLDRAPRTDAGRVGVALPARGVLIAGDETPDPQAAHDFAEAMGWPLLAEPQSNARIGERALRSYRYLLGHQPTRARLRPHAVVSLGRPGISREVQALLAAAEQVVVVDPHADWADPARSAHRVLTALPEPQPHDRDPQWWPAWRDADRAAGDAVDGFLDDADLSEPQVVREVLRRLPADGLCVLGSSMPIRDAEVTMAARRGPVVLCNRGLAGIDGVTSTAIGAAIAHQRAGGGSAYAVLGDLTFLHDVTALIRGRHTVLPDLTVVVLNNGGGGIFSLVGHTSAAVGFEELFATPHDVGIAALAASLGWRHDLASDIASLTACLGGGPRIVEVVTDRQLNAKLHHELTAHVGRALDAAAS